MVALPIDRTDRIDLMDQDLADPAVSTGGGWQSIRQQLFGEQRKREAEDRLIAILTQLDTRLAAATRDNRGGTPRTLPGRAAVLRATLDGANELFGWHREQCDAAAAAGWWMAPARDEAAWALTQARAAFPLLEAGEARDHAIRATDVIESIAQLRGAESAAFYNEALAGLTALLEMAYDRLRLDTPTAPAAASLEGTWQALLQELSAAAAPQAAVDDPNVTAATDALEGVALPDALPDALPAPVPQPVPVLRITAPAAPPEPDPARAVDGLARRILRFADQPAAPVDEPVALAAPRVVQSIAARFCRFELVAC